MDSRDNALMYIPASQDEIVLADITDSSGNVTISAQEQWNDLDTFINSVDYLRERRGQYAERNGSRGIWSHVVDLKDPSGFQLELGW